MVGCSYPNSVTPANIQSGFQVTRIHPFNGSVFTDDAFFRGKMVVKQPGTSGVPITPETYLAIQQSMKSTSRISGTQILTKNKPEK